MNLVPEIKSHMVYCQSWPGAPVTGFLNGRGICACGGRRQRGKRVCSAQRQPQVPFPRSSLSASTQAWDRTCFSRKKGDCVGVCPPCSGAVVTRSLRAVWGKPKRVQWQQEALVPRVGGWMFCHGVSPRAAGNVHNLGKLSSPPCPPPTARPCIM